MPRRALAGWERRAPRGDAPGWRGGGEETKFARAANLAVPHPAAGAPLSLRPARRGRPRRDRAARVPGPRSSPRRPQTQAAGRAWWGRASVPGEGRRRPDGVVLGRGTGLAQRRSPAGTLQGRGEAGRGRVSAAGIRTQGWGDREKFIHRITFQAAVMSARNCKETPLSGRSCAPFVSLPQGPHLGLPWAWRRLGDLVPGAGLVRPASRAPGWIRLPPCCLPAETFPRKSWGEEKGGLFLWGPPGSFLSSPGHFKSPVLPLQSCVSRGAGVQRRPGDFGRK